MKNQKRFFMGIWFTLSILCILYGLLVRALGSGTLFFIVWLGLGVFFFLFALAVKRELWKQLPRALKISLLFLSCTGLICFCIVEGCVIHGFSQEGKSDLDYILVLGAQVYENGPSAVLRYRLDRAIQYLEENPDTICILSGGQGYNEPCAEAEGMANYMMQKGISEDRLILETESSTTKQNIANSMALIEPEASVGIITNDFHLFRALQIAKAQGWKPVYGIAAPSNKFYLPNNMLREFFAEIKFLILH